MEDTTNFTRDDGRWTTEYAIGEAAFDVAFALDVIL